MSEEIIVIERTEQSVLCISEVTGTMKLGKVMGPAFLEIMDSLKQQNIESSEKDMPFTKYKNINWDRLDQKGIFAMFHMMFCHKWDMDIGIPCPESAVESGRIRKKTLEGGKFIRAIHKGPYMKVGDTYKKMRAYAEANNLKLRDFSVEFYLNDPRKVSPAQLETEVLVPLL
jgi:effector-binding domain-containing protein